MWKCFVYSMNSLNQVNNVKLQAGALNLKFYIRLERKVCIVIDLFIFIVFFFQQEAHTQKVYFLTTSF